MFDKLVESDTTSAEFKNRSRYFMVSSIVVGILFLTAVVYSLYAAEIGLGKGNFEIAELIAPVSANASEPEIKRTETSATSNPDTPRNINSDLAHPDEHPIVPIGASAEPNTKRSRGWEPFNPTLPESDGSGTPGGIGPGTGTTGSSSTPSNRNDSEDSPDRTSPPPLTKQIPKPKPVVSEGVINGKATYLPVPQYSAAAKAVNAQGTVNVQVTIDEQGNVISARAATGHPLLQLAAERAAKQAKFTPTLLSKVPVKVTGVIVYHFKRD